MLNISDFLDLCVVFGSSIIMLGFALFFLTVT